MAVPVYQGAPFVAETLRSILAQTHTDLSVMISVDGNDGESAGVCAPFLADTRVNMFVQERQLGWVANLNWLIDESDGDFYCYWQQDDICAPDYLEKLVAALTHHPGAACAYSDVRWFGRTTQVVVHPANVGLTQQRILSQIEALNWIPFRALVPTDVLRRVGAIGGLDGGPVFADSLWVLRLAAAGDLLRVPEALYLKRDHENSASQKAPPGGGYYSTREAWIRLGLTIFNDIAPHFEEGDRQKLAVVIADRLVLRRPERWFEYDATAVSASEPAQVAMDFFRALEAQSGVSAPIPEDDDASEESLLALRTQRERTIPGTVLRLVADAALVAPERRSLMRRMREGDALTVACSVDGSAAVLLLDGWSQPESWGTWSDGRVARLWLPLPGDGGPWRIRLVGQAYLGTSESPLSPRIIVSKDDRVLLDCNLTAGRDIPAFELAGDPEAGDGIILSIDMPHATSPAALGLGADRRSLTLGLEKVEMTRE